MHPTLQLLERHQREISEKSTHWFDSPESPSNLKENDLVFSLRNHQGNSASIESDQWPTSELNILFYPKAKERLFWWLDQISPQLKSTQSLWVVGENNGGIKSMPKKVKDLFQCEKLDSARHCALFELSPLETNQTHEENWKSFNQDTLTCYALPGVFSAGRLDKGTEILLEGLPQIKGRILEFGGGCGIITANLALKDQVTQVDALELDLLAVRSSLKTLKENNLDHKATTLWSDGTSNLPKAIYDAIVTNPPFHQGIRTEYGPTTAFFTEAHLWLKPGGKLIWVANDFLNYQETLSAFFTEFTCINQRNGFKVWQATRKR